MRRRDAKPRCSVGVVLITGKMDGSEPLLTSRFAVNLLSEKQDTTADLRLLGLRLMVLSFADRNFL